VMAEIAGVTNETKKEAEHAEVYAASLGRLKLEEKHLEEEHKKLEHEQQKLHAQIKILQQSLQTTETASHAVAKENKRIADQMNIIEDNIMKIHTQAAELYDQVLVKINEHKTLEKTSANLLKQAHMIDRVCDEKDIEREGVENEIARVHLDMLNTNNQIDMLKNKKREVSEERQKKEETVATYELEIRQGHDINEKKQAEVGKLNKVHDSIMSVAGESSRGPLDAHKNHLVNSIKETTEQVQRLERDWIKKQTKLVKYQEQQSKASEEIGNAKTKKTILEQKRMRLQTILNGHEKEIRGIKISLKNLQTEMNKLNDGLARNNTNETKLKNENYHIQSDVLEKLKELEKTNVKLELDIDSLKEEKADLLQNIVEAERQLLLWERKIQLEKEIQSALDPNIGQTELKVLKKDIHRMELRLEEIRKKQEQTIYEMERQVYKRDTIQLKYTQPDDMEDQKGAKSNQTKIAKQIDNLRSTLAQTSKNNKEYDKKLKQLQAEMNERTTLINEAMDASGVQEEELTETLAELVQRKVERVKNVFEIVKMQTNYRAYETIAANRFKLDFPENVLRQ
jgi:chromosome segregation ATPase